MRVNSMLLMGLGIGLLAGCLQANADPITYTFSGDLSADLSGTYFSNDPFTLTLTGDTAEVGYAYGFLCSSPAVADFTLAGFGSGTSTNLVRVFLPQPGVSPRVGFLDPFTDSGFDIYAPGLDTSYDLTSNIGPVTGSQDAEGSNFPTSLGIFNFEGFDGTFTASTDSTATPEPSAYALLVSLGLTGICLLRRRRTTR